MSNKIALQFKKPTGFLGRIISLLMVKGNRHAYLALIEKLAIKPSDKILEIGYGPGIGIYEIASNYTAIDLYGIDFSELMYKRACKRNKAYIDSNRVKLFYGDFINYELNTSEFNTVFCINVVYFWSNLQIPFSKIYQLLQPQGLFCFYMIDKEELSKLSFTDESVFNKYSIDQIVEVLSFVGFSQITYQFNKGYFIEARK